VTALSRAPSIYVLAGVNGAGKSSLMGARIRAEQGEYYNPDEAARRVQSANPGLSLADANGIAWQQGRRLLQRAIDERLDYSFETTLGGETIAELLRKAAAQGHQVHVWYVGLESVELHIARVRLRVEKGGHPIPEAKIQERYETSRLNLIDLFPILTTLRVYDNSFEADPREGTTPQPQLLLEMERGAIKSHGSLATAPTWIRPIFSAALNVKSS
jgi:predicted ABC-type ATPase